MKLGLIKDDKLLEKIPLVDVRFTHSLCVGQTGSGKTTSFVYPNILFEELSFFLDLRVDYNCEIELFHLYYILLFYPLTMIYITLPITT